MSFEYAEPGAMTEGPQGPLSGGSLMDQLASEFDTPLPSETLRIRVPRREQFVVVFDARIGYEQLKSMEARSKDADGKIDDLRGAVMVLASQNTAIELRGEQLMEDGKAVTFRSKSFVGSTGELDQIEALRKFFGDDADLLNAAALITDVSGYGNVERARSMVDPTGQ